MVFTLKKMSTSREFFVGILDISEYEFAIQHSFFLRGVDLDYFKKNTGMVGFMVWNYIYANKRHYPEMANEFNFMDNKGNVFNFPAKKKYFPQ